MLAIMTSCGKFVYKGMILPSRGIARGLETLKPEEQESSGQLVVRIRNYFNKWVELSEVDKTFEGMEELMI